MHSFAPLSNLKIFVKNRWIFYCFFPQNFAKFGQKLIAKFNHSLNVILELCYGVHCVDLGESFRTSIYLQKSASIQPRTSPSKFGGRYFQYDSIVSLGSSRRHALPLRARRPSRGRSWSGCRSANFGIWRGVDQSAVTLSRELWTRRSLRR